MFGERVPLQGDPVETFTERRLERYSLKKKHADSRRFLEVKILSAFFCLGGGFEHVFVEVE